ncbi:hypothetical protein CAPTEDRAFT_213081 [Capitella teleta]|uniref:Receptor ligand binding region domain-containing protein n=1 Tax=Capitella teleta TaxID=283909 RepID=R7VM81_CAPTE|nr:hypothetical protein CAPTEDRAFT_213081 [Capitella teleta]|eukprot:ELU18380.1 hypothetical protein CAPTEDRAFT_213081 [Capitella teleta]
MRLHLVESLTVLLACMLAWTADSLRVAVFAPKECSSVHVATMQRAMEADDANDWEFISSCTEVQTLEDILAISTNSSVDVIIGPGSKSLCSSVTALAGEIGVPLVSWSCSSGRHTPKNLITIPPSYERSARAIEELLKHFQWHTVGILSSTMFWLANYAQEIYVELALQGIQPLNLLFMDSTTSSNDIAELLNQMADCKGQFVTSDDLQNCVDYSISKAWLLHHSMKMACFTNGTVGIGWALNVINLAQGLAIVDQLNESNAYS